jgi:hypothetical protein
MRLALSSTSSSGSFLRQRWLFVSIGVILLLARAWPRLFYPQVWDEDGTRNLPGFFQNGIADIIEPLNGYLVLVPKLITLSAASISFGQYPLISTLLAWGVTLAVFYFIATAPIQLHGGLLLALACLLVPSDPEVFGLPLYTFWWVSILLFVVVFWNDQSRDWRSRSAIIVLASLSSPVCIVVLPLMWVRALWFRGSKLEIKLALLTTLCAGMQLWVMHRSAGLLESRLHIHALRKVIPKFLGAYTVGNILPQLEWVSGFLLLLLFVLAIVRDPRSRVKWGMAYLWCAAVFLTVSRAGIDFIHQVSAGPRYFFYPFIVQSWFLLQIALTESNRLLRGVAWFILFIAVLNAFPVLDRKQDDLNWKAHLDSCRHYDRYVIPVQFDGHAATAWGLEMTKQQCESLLAKDPFYRPTDALGFPFRVISKAADGGLFLPKLVTVGSRNVQAGNEWLGADFGKSRFDGMVVLGSFIDSDANTGSLVVDMKRGDKLLYRSGPMRGKQIVEVLGTRFSATNLPAATDWVLLDFSNDLLPEEFAVRFSDRGTGWGEWSAIALKSD